MTKYEVHDVITARILSVEMSDLDVLLYLVVLHTHAIRLRPDVTIDDIVNEDPSQGILLYPITHRHMSEVAAACWPAGNDRADPMYWYQKYNELTPYEVFEDVPTDRRARMDDFIQLLLGDPLIEVVMKDE